mmetsp:Transcript_73501/g.132402  ORF Transcript_73501/g.132402 Transcript_73501/m.132402 type:complete len:107 (-) Transcript_73501:278-598(-)
MKLWLLRLFVLFFCCCCCWVGLLLFQTILKPSSVQNPPKHLPKTDHGTPGCSYSRFFKRSFTSSALVFLDIINTHLSEVCVGTDSRFHTDILRLGITKTWISLLFS